MPQQRTSSIETVIEMAVSRRNVQFASGRCYSAGATVGRVRGTLAGFSSISPTNCFGDIADDLPNRHCIFHRLKR